MLFAFGWDDLTHAISSYGLVFGAWSLVITFAYGQARNKDKEKQDQARASDAREEKFRKDRLENINQKLFEKQREFEQQQTEELTVLSNRIEMLQQLLDRAMKVCDQQRDYIINLENSGHHVEGLVKPNLDSSVTIVDIAKVYGVTRKPEERTT